MKKRDELTNPASCMSRAREDEWTFVLLGRDAAAPDTIRAWCQQRVALGKNTMEDAQIHEALACAAAMEAARVMPEGQKARVTQCAAAIIDAIPEALGMTPDPWPIDGPSYDGEPHKTVERLLLALLLAEAPRQDQENTEVTRVETMGDSQDNPTASENETTPATVIPNQVSPEPLHASAPPGSKCSDCTIDGEPCPTCYEAWWRTRHPHHASH